VIRSSRDTPFPDGSKIPEYTFDQVPSRPIFLRVAKAVAQELGFEIEE
jgi:hypothetical protein